MPYIPERRFEDKPDTFTPFVPMDPDTKVEICDTQFSKDSVPKEYKRKIYSKYLLYILFIFVVLYILKKFT